MSTPVKADASGTDSTRPPPAAWPPVLRISPRWLLLVVGVWLATAWSLFLVVDVLSLGGLDELLFRPAWWHLFNDRPVEWSQWFLLAFFAVAAGYLAGRLSAQGERGPAAFFGLIGVGAGLMLIEDAGDIRHVVSGYVQRHLGDEVLGLPYRVVSDVPYFALLALVPIYAVVRYGRYPWRVPAVRPFLVAAVALYAAASIGSGLRHLGDFYIRVGAAIDTALLGGRFPIPPGLPPERAHFLLVDSLIEETVELVAVTCLFAVVLAFVRARYPAAR